MAPAELSPPAAPSPATFVAYQSLPLPLPPSSPPASMRSAARFPRQPRAFRAPERWILNGRLENPETGIHRNLWRGGAGRQRHPLPLQEAAAGPPERRIPPGDRAGSLQAPHRARLLPSHLQRGEGFWKERWKGRGEEELNACKVSLSAEQSKAPLSGDSVEKRAHSPGKVRTRCPHTRCPYLKHRCQCGAACTAKKDLTEKVSGLQIALANCFVSN